MYEERGKYIFDRFNDLPIHFILITKKNDKGCLFFTFKQRNNLTSSFCFNFNNNWRIEVELFSERKFLIIVFVNKNIRTIPIWNNLFNNCFYCLGSISKIVLFPTLPKLKRISSSIINSFFTSNL